MSIKYNSKDLERDYGRLSFADLLYIQREDEQLTQVEMAKKLGITKQKLCDFEKGRRVPSPKMAASWAKKLGHPQEVWVQVVLQDQLERDDLDFEVSIAY
ncbi:MAG: helix-turn-helix transcriptional regulator [Bacteriovoracales bacterium]|nr:helix-turn-helix transcriptional regulator [Bacteriovoracales bacterium]